MLIMQRQSLCFVYIVTYYVHSVVCVDCVTKDYCSCIFDDGSGMVDLTSLGRTDGTPVFYDIPSALDSSVYSFNPCHAFQEGMCTDVSICRFDYVDYTYSDLGAVESAKFSYDGQDVVAKYKSLDGQRSTDVKLVCDKTYSTPNMDVYGEDSPMHYSMTVTAASICPKEAPPGSYSTSGGSISVGSILLIIFFVLLVVYFVAGAATSRYKRGASGKELIPNLGFWSSLPGLIREGFVFTANMTCRRKRQSYAVI